MYQDLGQLQLHVNFYDCPKRSKMGRYLPAATFAPDFGAFPA